MALTQNAMIGISSQSEQFADCWVLTNPSQPKSRDATEQPSNKAEQREVATLRGVAEQPSKSSALRAAALRGVAEQQSNYQCYALIIAEL